MAPARSVDQDCCAAGVSAAGLYEQPSALPVGRGADAPALGEVGVHVDAVAVLATMVIENRFARRAPALIYGTSTEIARNACKYPTLPYPRPASARGPQPPPTDPPLP